MRIISGKLKGSILNITKNRSTRPLKDSARENMFNLITHSNKVLFHFEKAKILDLYSGTGSFGLECLSRGAESVYFVEKEKDAILTLEKNIEKLNVRNKVKIFSDDVFNLINKENLSKQKFNLIFCDPPFKNENIKSLLELIFKKNLLSKKGIIIFHRKTDTKESLPNCFEILDERKYGKSKITFGKFLI